MSVLQQSALDDMLSDAINSSDADSPTTHSISPSDSAVPHTNIKGYTYTLVTKLGNVLDPNTSMSLAICGVQASPQAEGSQGGKPFYWFALAGADLDDGEVAIVRLSKQAIRRATYFYTVDPTGAGCSVTRLSDIDTASRTDTIATLVDKIYDVDVSTGVPRAKHAAEDDAIAPEKGYNPTQSYSVMPSTVPVNIPTGARSTPATDYDPGVDIPPDAVSSLNKPSTLSDLALADTVDKNSTSSISQKQQSEEDVARRYEEQPWLAPPIPYLSSTREVLEQVWKSDYMRIGYAALEIPPEQIFYVKDMPDKVKPLLRADGTLKTSYGVSADNFQIHITLDNPIATNRTLLPIVRQYLRTPFLPVVNELLNQTYGTQALAITGIQVSTRPQFPGEIDVVVQADKFNFQGYLLGEPSLDSTVCYPLLKIWAEHDTPTRPLPTELDGAFEIYVPNRGYLEAMDASLEAQAQQANNFDLQRNGIDTPTAAGPGSFLYTDASSCAQAVTDLRDGRSLSTFPTTPVRGSTYLPNCTIKAVEKKTPLSEKLNWGCSHSSESTSTTGARAIINVSNPMVFRDVISFLQKVDAAMGAVPAGAVQGPCDDTLLEPAILEGEVTITSDAGLGNYTVHLNGNLLPATYPSDLYDSSVLPDEELAELLKNVYIVLRKRWLDVAPKLTNDLLAKLAGYTMQDPANLPDELNEPVWDKVVLSSFTIEQITVGMESVLAMHTPRSSSGALHQFLGRNDTHVVVSGVVSNEQDLELLRHTLERQEELVRNYNGNMLGTRKYEGYMLLKNEVCRLLGVTHVLPSNVSVQTMPDYPGSHSVQITFVQYNPSQEKREAIQEYEAALWNDKTGDPKNSATGLGLESRNDTIPMYALRAEQLNDRLRTIELYPDMHLPTYENLRTWVSVLLQEDEDLRDEQLEELGIDSTEFMWSHEDCALLQHPYYRVCDYTGFVDPDFCFAPSFPHSGDLITGILQTMSGNSNLPTQINPEAGIAPTRDALRIVGQDAADVRNLNFFDINNPVYTQKTGGSRAATFIEARDAAAADAALKQYNDETTRILVPVKDDTAPGGASKYEVVNLGKLGDASNWQTGFTQEHLNLIRKTAREFDIPEVVALLLFKSEGGLNDADTSNDSIGLGQLQRITFVSTTQNCSKYGYPWPFGAVPDLSSDAAKTEWAKQRLEPPKAIWASLAYYKMRRLDLERVWCKNNGTTLSDITPDTDRLMWQCTEMLYRLPSQLSVLKKDKKMTLPVFYNYLYNHTSSSFQRRTTNVGAALTTKRQDDVNTRQATPQKNEKVRANFDVVAINTKTGDVTKLPAYSVKFKKDPKSSDFKTVALETYSSGKLAPYEFSAYPGWLQLVGNDICSMGASVWQVFLQNLKIAGVSIKTWGEVAPEATGSKIPFTLETPVALPRPYTVTSRTTITNQLDCLIYFVSPKTTVPDKLTAENTAAFFNNTVFALPTEDFVKGMTSTKVDADEEWKRLYRGHEKTAAARESYKAGLPTTSELPTPQSDEALVGTGPDFYTMDEMFLREDPDRAYYHQDMFHDMRRYAMGNRLLPAFPSYLVLLVDGGKWMRMWRLYDYLYGMSCVESIDVFKTRKTPVDVATLKFSNMYGRLATDKSFSPQGKKWQWSLAEVEGAAQRLWSSFAGGFTTEMKQAWARSRLGIILRPGVRLHIRLGYGADGTRLPIVFNGTISEVEPGQDEMEVVALGDGQELEHQMSAEGEKWKKHGFFGAPTSPHDIITSIMAPLSVVKATTWGNYDANNPWGIEHFGSHQLGFWYQDIAEIGMNIYAATANSIGCDRAFASENTWLQGLQQLNIIPGYGLYDDTKIKFDIGVNMDAATPWSVINLCRKSVPGFIAAVHPFGLHSTLFYGKPYWPLRYDYKPGVVARNTRDDARPEMVSRDKNLDDVTLWKPYAQVHVISSITNLLDNRITANSEELFTQCQAEGSFNGTITADDSEEWSDLMFLDTDILPEYQKKLFVQSGMYSTRWAKTVDQLKGVSLQFWRPRHPLNCYAVNSLRDSVMDMYQGAAVIMGDGSIKPHDPVFLADLVTEMSGVFFAKEITHHIDTYTGFTSTVCPDLSASMAELADDATHCWVAMFGQKYVGNLSVQSTVGRFLSQHMSPIPMMTKILGKLSKIDNKYTAGLGAEIVDIIKEFEPRSKATKAIDGIFKRLMERGSYGAGEQDAADAIASLDEKIRELQAAEELKPSKELKLLLRQKRILQREMAINIDSLTGPDDMRAWGGAEDSIERLATQAQESLERVQGELRNYRSQISTQMEAVAEGSSEWKTLNRELQALEEIAGEDFGVAKMLREGKNGWKLTSTLLKAGRYGNRLAGASSLAEARAILQEINVATVLGPKAATMAKIGPQLVIYVLADSIVGWLNRKMAARQTLVLRPLSLSGREMTAGIDGHLGCVAGDPVGFWDGVLQSMFCWKYVLPQQAPTTTGGWIYQGGATLVKGLLNLVGMALGFQGIDYAHNVPGDDLHRFVYGDANLTPADIQARRTELERWYRDVRNGEVAPIAGSTSVAGSESEILGRGANLNVYKNTPVYVRGVSKGGGKTFQCVDFVKDFYKTAMGVNTSTWHGNGGDYYDSWQVKGLKPHANGGAVAPREDDILCWSGGPYGHVAIVKSVDLDAGTVEIVESNWSSTKTTAVLRIHTSTASGRATYTMSNRGRFRTQGWLRL